MDDLDKKIILNFISLKKEEKKFSEIIRKILGCEKVGNKEYNLVYNRIHKMSHFKIFKIVQNSNTRFELNPEVVLKRKFSFPKRRRVGLAVLIDGKWKVFEL